MTEQFSGIKIAPSAEPEYLIAAYSGDKLVWGIKDLDEITEDFGTEQVAIINHHCPYCGSHSPDDPRGNCSACGGPR